jgi:hypothetical protein
MTVIREYQAALVYLEQDIDGFLGASFVNMDTHEILAAHSVRPEFPLAAVSGSCSRLVELHYRNAEGAEIGFEEMLVTLGEHFHVCRVVCPRVLLFVAADRAATNLALIKVSVQSRTMELREVAGVLPAWVA